MTALEEKRTSLVSIPEMVRLIVNSRLWNLRRKASFNSRDGAIDRKLLLLILTKYQGFNSRDGAIDSGATFCFTPGFTVFQFQRWCD